MIEGIFSTRECFRPTSLWAVVRISRNGSFVIPRTVATSKAAAMKAWRELNRGLTSEEFERRRAAGLIEVRRVVVRQATG